MKPIVKALILLVITAQAVSCSPRASLQDLPTWDLVWISDSSGWGVAPIYGAMVAEDNGVEVIVHDNWIGHLAAGDVLAALQGEETPSYTLANLADQIREAEVIVVYGNPTQSWGEGNPADWNCVGGTLYVNNCDMETFNTYIEHMKGIYQIIFELRRGQPTIVRAIDAYNPLVKRFQEAGVYEACKTCWDRYNAAIHSAAAAYHVPVAGVADAWNGPSWEVDPVEAGYTKDGEHPNQKGAQVIAEALRATGYDPVSP